MTNDEWRMHDEIRITNISSRWLVRHLSILASFVIRHSSLSILRKLPDSRQISKWKRFGVGAFCIEKIMNPIKGEQLLPQLNWRWATKKFDPARKISPEDWAVMEGALILSPSSYGLQRWTFVVITDHFMTSAALPGIDTCPMEGFKRDEYDEILEASGEASDLSCLLRGRLSFGRR